MREQRTFYLRFFNIRKEKYYEKKMDRNSTCSSYGSRHTGRLQFETGGDTGSCPGGDDGRCRDCPDGGAFRYGGRDKLSTVAQEYGPILSKAKESGKLVAAINAQSPPWRFHKIVDGQDKLCGFEISMCYGLADYVSEKLGTEVEVEINDMTFPGVLAALQAGQVDFAPSLAGTEERRQNMDFSIPYHRSLQTIVIKKDRENEDIFAPENGMNGVSTASLQGSSTSVTFAEQYPDANLIDYESTPDIVLAVANGKVDAAVLNEKYAILICKANPDLMIDYDLSFDIPVDRDPGASIAIPKGNEDFVELVDEWLNTILSDGTFS